MHTVYLGLGANIGDREQNIRRAIQLIGEQIGAVEAQSALFYSKPWGFRSDNDFVNAAIRVATTLTPHRLLNATQRIERLLGKTAQHATQRTDSPTTTDAPAYHDRPIDIDILLYDDRTIDTPRLKVPHPLIAQRPFVAVPLAEVMKGAEE